MSKAPGAASDYDGSGEWFKIHDDGKTQSNVLLEIYLLTIHTHRPDIQRLDRNLGPSP